MTLSFGTRVTKAGRGIALAAAISAIGTCAIAQDQPVAGADESLDQVYATVDGVPITGADLAVVAQDYAQQIGRAPVDLRIPELLEAVIDMRLLADAAEKAGLDEDDTVKRRLDFERMRTLRNEYLRDAATKAVTDEAVKAKFDAEMTDFKPGDERHLRHILVETEDEAKTIIADIEAGGDFAAIATEKSLDPGSAPKGGDLDFVGKGLTVPEFEKAAFALEIGEFTKEPVKTQFGWHVILLEETRDAPPPEFSSEERRIRTEMIREFVTNQVETLRAAATIDIVPPPEPPAPEAEAETETPAQ